MSAALEEFCGSVFWVSDCIIPCACSRCPTLSYTALWGGGQWIPRLTACPASETQVPVVGQRVWGLSRSAVVLSAARCLHSVHQTVRQ